VSFVDLVVQNQPANLLFYWVAHTLDKVLIKRIWVAFFQFQKQLSGRFSYNFRGISQLCANILHKLVKLRRSFLDERWLEGEERWNHQHGMLSCPLVLIRQTDAY